MSQCSRTLASEDGGRGVLPLHQYHGLSGEGWVRGGGVGRGGSGGEGKGVKAVADKVSTHFYRPQKQRKH